MPSLRLLSPIAILLGCAAWEQLASSQAHDGAEQVYDRPRDPLELAATSTKQVRDHSREVGSKLSEAKGADNEGEGTQDDVEAYDDAEEDADIHAEEEPEEGKHDEVKAHHDVEEEADLDAEAEEPEEAVSPVDMAIAWMLIGEIMFVMMIFYVVNYEDADIKYYAWLVISSTVSIFTAVQMFNGVQGVLEYVVLEHLSDVHRVVASYMFLLVGLLVLQAVIMMMAKAGCARPSLINVDEDDEDDRQMHCWSTLLSHMVAFSSIHAGGSLQQLPLFSSSPIASTLATGAHCMIIFVLLATFDRGRAVLNRDKNEPTNLVCYERTMEAEDDIAALSISFLFIQAVRYSLSGILPNLEGLEEPQHIHPLTCSLGLAAVAMAFALAVVSILWMESKCQFAHGSRIKRCLLILQAIAAMAFAWSVFYAMKWQLARLIPHVHPNSMSARVPLALAVSAASFALIFVLDYLEDLDATGEDADRAIASIICALGFLVGFSWEQSFEGAASCLSSTVPEWSTWAKLCQACIVGLITIPAWRKYILKECLDREEKAQPAQSSKCRITRKTCAYRHSLTIHVATTTIRQSQLRELEVCHTDEPRPSLLFRSHQETCAHKVQFETE